MKPVRIEKFIDAAPEDVFEVVAHIENFRKAVDDIVGVRFISETHRGRGTVFEETRKIGKREAKVEMEIVDYTPPNSLRIVSRPDEMGTTWDSHFTISRVGQQTRLDLEMKAEGKKWFPRLMNALFAGMIRRAVDRDMESLKRYCETPR